jgi:DNA-binding NarL/FixJ family response regulator
MRKVGTMARGTLGLTARQELYLRGTCRGDARREIAEEAYVSEHAIRNAMSYLYRALGVRNAAAACYALGIEDMRQSVEPFLLKGDTP